MEWFWFFVIAVILLMIWNVLMGIRTDLLSFHRTVVSEFIKNERMKK